MENMPSMYHRARPMTKVAALPFPGVLGGFAASGRRFLGNAYNSARNYAKNNPLTVAGAGIGLLGGAWLGNKAYNAQIPPVRSLPRLEQRPMIHPIYQD